MTREQNAAVRRQIANAKRAITPEKIMEIAARKGSFSVNWQYRNDWLRGICNRLCKLRKLRKVSDNRGLTVYAVDREYAKHVGTEHIFERWIPKAQERN